MLKNFPRLPMKCTVKNVTFKDVRSNDHVIITADYVIDATELGDLLPITNCEYVTGFQGQTEYRNIV